MWGPLGLNYNGSGWVVGGVDFPGREGTPMQTMVAVTAVTATIRNSERVGRSMSRRRHGRVLPRNRVHKAPFFGIWKDRRPPMRSRRKCGAVVE